MEENRIPRKGLKNIQEEINQSRDQLKLDLLQRTEDKVSEKGTDESLDKEILKKRLLQEGESKDITEQAEQFIMKVKAEYIPMFPLEFYKQIYRLNNWEGDPKEYTKPKIVGKWTNDLIYARFPKDTLVALQILNPLASSGFRPDKHFQWLNEEGRYKLSTYIGQAVDLMQKSENWYEFRKLYYKEYGVGFQLNLFKESDISS